MFSLLAALVAIQLIGFLTVGRLLAKNKEIVAEMKGKLSESPTAVHVDFSSLENKLTAQMRAIPPFILQSITGTGNAEKGRLGELVGYLTIKAEYDKIIPLGGITDFVGIKFPSDKEAHDGKVDFIDVKTGKQSRLTTDQRNLKKILDASRVNFRTIKIDDIQLD